MITMTARIMGGHNKPSVSFKRNIMNRIVVEQRVRDDGVLQFSLPLGADQSSREVRVTVESIGPKVGITPDEWRAGILATAGGWQGEFERPPQGKLEE
jgi:hypothetical protein